jgi:hypothetical protein
VIEIAHLADQAADIGPQVLQEHWRSIRPQRVRIVAMTPRLYGRPFEYELAERFAVFHRGRLALWHRRPPTFGPLS